MMIVDGSNLLFQMFYGMPARITSPSGKAIQGTLGFVGALLKMLRMVRPTHVAVLFDGECANQRTELDESYKANREDFTEMPEEDTPFSQLPDIYAALDYLGICHRETADCEADDWIAGYARRYGDSFEVVIASQDSDFFQLIGEHTCILRYRGKQSQLWGREELFEKFGIAPTQYAAFKAMTGDNADNIRGIPKIGPKTAAMLLQRFGTLEGLLAQVSQVEKPSIRSTLEAHEERLRLNFRLIDLEGARELPFAPEEMVWQDSGLTTTQVLTALQLR